MTKQELRDVYLQKRRNLSEAEYTSNNRRLCDHLFEEVSFEHIKVIHVFLPIHRFREPDTWMIIDRLHRTYPHVRIVVPRVNALTNRMDHFYFEGLHQLQRSKWGILEPAHGTAAVIQDINMVLVPLLVVDRQGHRLGYGKGFYDKFLAHTGPSCKKIGLSHFPPLDEVPHDINDVLLDMCITPEGVIRFK